jgi:hypothetical protein
MRILPRASGSDPNRLGPRVPLKQNVSTKAQMLRTKATSPMKKTAFDSPSRSPTSPISIGKTKNGTIHQPLLLRSRSRLIVVADEQWIGDRVDQYGKQDDPRGIGVAQAAGERVNRCCQIQHCPDQVDQTCEPVFGAIDAAFKTEQKRPQIHDLSSGLPRMARGLAHRSRPALFRFEVKLMGQHGAAQIPARFAGPSPAAYRWARGDQARTDWALSSLSSRTARQSPRGKERMR